MTIYQCTKCEFKSCRLFRYRKHKAEHQKIEAEQNAKLPYAYLDFIQINVGEWP